MNVARASKFLRILPTPNYIICFSKPSRKDNIEMLLDSRLKMPIIWSIINSIIKLDWFNSLSLWCIWEGRDQLVWKSIRFVNAYQWVVLVRFFFYDRKMMGNSMLESSSIKIKKKVKITSTYFWTRNYYILPL